MKLRQIKKTSDETKSAVSQLKSCKSVTRPAGYGFVTLRHGQGVKLSRNYQSADVTYSAEIVVRDNPKQIRKGLRRLESIIEAPLVQKVQEQHELLNKLA